MKAKRPSIYWLKEFGLSIGQLTSLGSTKIKLHVDLRHINEKSLFHLKPIQRVDKTKRHYEMLLSRVKEKWTYGPFVVTYTRRQPRGFSATVEAKNVPRLRQISGIGHIWLDAIPGRKRVNSKPAERWFSVKARFAIQVEGQKTGMHSFEDRIVMVKAVSFEDAEKRLRPEFKQYATPYLNPDGFMVRWAFERTLDVYEVGDEKINPQGMEVFSALVQRRIKPQYAWKTKD